jgi:hypothetical protein
MEENHKPSGGALNFFSRVVGLGVDFPPYELGHQPQQKK